jgi:hypothetical protein
LKPAHPKKPGRDGAKPSQKAEPQGRRSAQREDGDAPRPVVGPSDPPSSAPPASNPPILQSSNPPILQSSNPPILQSLRPPPIAHRPPTHRPSVHRPPATVPPATVHRPTVLRLSVLRPPPPPTHRADCAPPNPASASHEDTAASFRCWYAPANPGRCVYPPPTPADESRMNAATHEASPAC